MARPGGRHPGRPGERPAPAGSAGPPGPGAAPGDAGAGTGASVLPDRTAEAADALSRYQASRQAARTSSENEFGWLS